MVPTVLCVPDGEVGTGPPSVTVRHLAEGAVCRLS